MNLTTQTLTPFSKTMKPVFALYTAAFPKEERFSPITIRLWLWRGYTRGAAYFLDGTFAGFSLIAPQKDKAFLQYLAVSPEVRGRGVGSAILKELQSRYPDRTLFLDAEVPDEAAPNAAQRRRRIEFYERCGLHRTGVPFRMRGVDYEILATDPEFSPQDLEAFWKNVR